MNTIRSLALRVFLFLATLPISGIFAAPSTNTVEMRQYNGTGWVPLQLTPLVAPGLLQMSAGGTPSFSTSPETQSLNVDQFLDYTQIAAPSSPALNHLRVYFDGTAGFSFKTNGGTVYTFPGFSYPFSANNGVVYVSATTGLLAGTAAGGSNTVLVGGGTPSFTATPTLNSLTVNTGGSSSTLSVNNNNGVVTQLVSNGTETDLINSTGALVLKSNNTTAVTIDSSQNATFAEQVKLTSGTTSANGLAFSDVWLYRSAAQKLAISGSGAVDAFLEFYNNGTRSGYFQTNGTASFLMNGSSTVSMYTGGVAAVTYDSSQRPQYTPNFKSISNNTGTPIVNCTLTSNTVVAGTMDYSVQVFNGTDLQVEVGTISFQAVNKGGVFSGNSVVKTGNQQSATSGTLSVTWTITGANPAVVTLNANSSLTPSAGYPRITYTLKNLTQQAMAFQ